jgi:hypothetical protein
VHRDEQASPPIYNYARALPWAQAVEEVYRVFEEAAARAERHLSVDPQIPWEREEKGPRGKVKVSAQNRRGTLAQVEMYVRPTRSVSRSHWGPGVFSRIFVSSLLALALTWATTGAAVIVVFFTPTIGTHARRSLNNQTLLIKIQASGAAPVRTSCTAQPPPSSGCCSSPPAPSRTTLRTSPRI